VREVAQIAGSERGVRITGDNRCEANQCGVDLIELTEAVEDGFRHREPPQAGDAEGPPPEEARAGLGRQPEPDEPRSLRTRGF